jgi:DNA-directed RNA polymerase specialized sigma24 family protein
MIIMRFEFGMSFIEMAEELHESPDGVRMKLNRAIQRMATPELN